MRKGNIKSFDNFLKYYYFADKGVYAKSGLAVEMLVKKYGNGKLLQVISDMKFINTA